MMLGLSPNEILALAGIAFLAGIVRGFTGFGLSAFALSLAVLILPPVALIPVLWWPELLSGLATLRGGWREGDKRAALTLVIGSFVGMIIGLQFTTRVDPDLSAQVALIVLVTLSLLQLFRLRLPALDTQAGTVCAGLLAGVVTGLAGIGGMVIALFVLAQSAPAARMRGTLILFLLFGSISSFGTHLAYGTMTWEATLRGLAFSVPCLAGVALGAACFIPRWERYYRPVCLTLLTGLGIAALWRMNLPATDVSPSNA